MPNFDEILGAAKKDQKPVEPPPKQQAKPAKKTTTKKPDPWADIETPEPEATIRLNVDITIDLNDKLADEARRRRTSKSELVRKLLEWALE